MHRKAVGVIVGGDAVANRGDGTEARHHDAARLRHT